MFAPDINGQAESLSATLIFMLLICGIGLSPVGDFLSVYALKGGVSGDFGARYSLFLRGMTVSGALVAIALSGHVRASGLRILALVIVAIGASSCAYMVGEMTGSEYVEEVIFVLKVFSLFVYAAAISRLDDRHLATLEYVVRIVLLIYALSIVLGAIFSISMFHSYRGDTQPRAGYKGIVYAQNETSALLMVALAYGMLRVLRFGWSVFDAMYVCVMLVAAPLVGTKGAIVGALGVITVYSFSRHRFFNAAIRVGIVIAILAAAAVTAYLLSSSIRHAVDLSVRYFEFQRGRADGDQILSVLMSGRNVKFSNVWDELGQQDYLAILTGGYPTVRYPIELDGPDLVLALGLPVFLFYAFDLWRLFNYRGRSSVARFGRLFFIVLVCIACTAGHVLDSAIVSPFLALVAVLIGRHSHSGGKRELAQEGNHVHE